MRNEEASGGLLARRYVSAGLDPVCFNGSLRGSMIRASPEGAGLSDRGDGKT